jgi:phosphate acetyltransferase
MTDLFTKAQPLPTAGGVVGADGFRHDKFERLVARAQRHSPVITAVAHPCDEVSLHGAVEAARLRLIEPILAGPERRIRELAEASG